MTQALQIIRQEHFNISSVLICLRDLVRRLDRGEWEPDFELLDSIVEYMGSFPDFFHHPKEEGYLFVAMLKRQPASAPLLETLCEQHADGHRALERLRTTLAAYRADPAAFPAFREAAEAYLDVERRHMRLEERELLPLALETLEPADWAEVNAAFQRNQDPLFGAEPDQRFHALFRRILDLAPVPLGFGHGRRPAVKNAPKS